MNYKEVIDYIHSISWTGSRPGLERINELLGMMGNPQDELRVIHVAGTNGKGSFCAMIESILRNAGYKTGLYISPYISCFNERIQADGRMISDGELVTLTEYVKKFADKMKDPPTEFELISAIAFEYFKRSKRDIVVLEVGMGGRLDATNVIKTPLLSVITGISLDHTAYLGDTIPQIASEKAGIIKKNLPVLFGGKDRKAHDVIKKRAEELSSEFFKTDFENLTNIDCRLGIAQFDFRGKRYQIPLSGLYQPQNAANALAAAHILCEKGLYISEKAMEEGLKTVSWPGRFEIISQDPLVIFDGSHNIEGAEAAIESIRHYFPGVKPYLLSGILRDKDYKTIAQRISGVISRAYILKPDSPRALDAGEYADIYKSMGIDSFAYDCIKEAVENAIAGAKRDGVPLIAMGSLYLYRDITQAVKNILGSKK